jgi:phosphomannomutase
MIKFENNSWTARISEEVTFANVEKVARAYAAYLTGKKIAAKGAIIGYDSRFLSEKFAERAVIVMEEFGISSYLTERDTPLPVIDWEVKDKKVAGALVVTGGNLPAEYSGIKIIPEDEETTEAIDANLEKPPTSVGVYPAKGKAERFEPRNRYLAYVENQVDTEVIKQARLRVVVDPMYGSGRGYLDLILQKLGCRVEEIHGYRDVLFGGAQPDPSEENLSGLKTKVSELKADLGLALSGDGVSFAVIDRSGRYYPAQNDGIEGALRAAEKVARGKL